MRWNWAGGEEEGGWEERRAFLLWHMRGRLIVCVRGRWESRHRALCMEWRDPEGSEFSYLHSIGRVGQRRGGGIEQRGGVLNGWGSKTISSIAGEGKTRKASVRRAIREVSQGLRC